MSCQEGNVGLGSCRYQTLAVATDANTKEDIGNKKLSGKKLTVSHNCM